MCPAQASATTNAEFSVLFREHAPYAWRCLRRLGVSAGDVEDVCQESFLIVHRKLAEFDQTASFRAWLYGICVRKASDYRRTAHRKREMLGEPPPDQGEFRDPAELLDQQKARDLLDEMLDRLDDKQREVFVLYEIEGLPMNEVSLAIGSPVQTAYSRLHAARKQMEAAIARTRAKGAS